MAWISFAGCERPPQEWTVVARSIDGLPESLFDTGSLFERRVVHVEDLSREVPGPGENPHVVLFEDLVAANLDDLSLDVAAMTQGQMVASWEGSDASGPVVGQMVLRSAHALRLEDGSLRFRFPLADSPEWRGRIRRLVVHTGARFRRGIRPMRAELATRVAAPETLTRAVAVPWLVESQTDRRPSWLLSPGHPRQLDPPAGGADRLEFSLAKSPTNRSPYEVRVVGSARAGESRTIWRAILRPEDEGWREVRIELATGAEKVDRLRVEVDGPAGGVVYLANPTFLAPTAHRRPNLVLISIDTLRADHLSLYGYPKPTSPVLDAWARQAVVFRRTVASATTTLPSHTSLFTGIEAMRHGVHGVPAPPSLTTLAAHLRQSGWRTLARTGGGFLHPHFGLNRGFERFSFHLQGVDGAGELAASLNVVRPWLEELRDEPFFLFLHSYEVHGPYRPRMPYLAELAPGVAPVGLAWPAAERSGVETGFRKEREASYSYRGEDPNGVELGRAGPAEAVAFYDSSIRYVDFRLGELFAELERLDLARDTVVVITSDHGEAFGEHGEAGHGYLHDDNVMVPLIVYAPGQTTAHEVTQQVRSVDVLPTVLDLLGAPPISGIDGASLRPALTGQPVPGLPEDAMTYAGHTGYGLALRTQERLELIVSNGLWSPYRGTSSLFDLALDPAESRDLQSTDPRAGELKRRLLASWMRVAPGLLLTVEVPGESPVGLRLTHPDLGPLRVGVLDYSGGATWDAGLHLDLSPRSTARFLLDLQPEAVEVEVAGESRTLQGPRGVSSLGGAFLRWEWRGLDARREAPRTEDDSRLHEQLRALGYVN